MTTIELPRSAAIRVKVSEASSIVAKASFDSKGTVSISVSGTVLTAVVDIWAPTPDRYSYQWCRNGKAISKANGEAYDRTTSTGEFKVRVTAILTGYYSSSVYSTVFKP